LSCLWQTGMANWIEISGTALLNFVIDFVLIWTMVLAGASLWQQFSWSSYLQPMYLYIMICDLWPPNIWYIYLQFHRDIAWCARLDKNWCFWVVQVTKRCPLEEVLYMPVKQPLYLMDANGCSRTSTRCVLLFSFVKCLHNSMYTHLNSPFHVYRGYIC
jgi:hypothetical protein